MPVNLPNLLTLLRITLIPVLVVVFYLPGSWSPFLSAAVFGLAAITDWLDGYLARRLGLTSSFGEFLDPVADKLMVATALLLLVAAHRSAAFTIPAAIIVGREITISALREWMSALGEMARVRVHKIGKIKTIVQMVAVTMLLYRNPLLGLPIGLIGHALLIAAAGLTIWSMFIYMRSAWPILSREGPKSP